MEIVDRACEFAHVVKADALHGNRGCEPSFSIDGGSEFDFRLRERSNVRLGIGGYGNDLELAFIFLLPTIQLRNPFS